MSINSIGYTSQNMNALTPANNASFGDNSQAMPQAQGSSGLGKVVVGAGLLGLAATGVYLVTKHRFKPIEFKPAKNISEAKAFSSHKLGVKMQKDDVPLDVANFINEAFCYLRNNTRNNFRLRFFTFNKVKPNGKKDFNTFAQLVTNAPSTNGYGIAFNKSFFDKIDKHVAREIKTAMGKGQENSVAFLKYENGSYALDEISPRFDIENEVLSLANKFKKSARSMTLKEKFTLLDGLANMKNSINSLAQRGELGKVSEAVHVKCNPFHHLFSLNGGVELTQKLGADKVNNMLPIDCIKGSNADMNTVLDFLANNTTTARMVSENAAKSPYHFVTETYARMLNGEKFDKEVMDLYSKLEGPRV